MCGFGVGNGGRLGVESRGLWMGGGGVGGEYVLDALLLDCL